MKNETKKAKENRLNNSYQELDFETNQENLIYLTNKSRGKSIRLSTLNRYILEGRIGTLLRMHDSISFQCHD